MGKLRSGLTFIVIMFRKVTFWKFPILKMRLRFLFSKVPHGPIWLLKNELYTITGGSRHIYRYIWRQNAKNYWNFQKWYICRLWRILLKNTENTLKISPAALKNTLFLRYMCPAPHSRLLKFRASDIYGGYPLYTQRKGNWSFGGSMAGGAIAMPDISDLSGSVINSNYDTVWCRY